MIVAYAPGGCNDLVARAIAPYIERYIGGDAIGFSAGRLADTIGLINTPNMLTIPIERRTSFT